MAIDLKAIFSVQDNGSKKLRDISKSMNAMDKVIKRSAKSQDLFRDSNNRLRDSFGRFAKEPQRGANGLRNFGSALRETASFGGRVVRAINPLGLALGGIAASAGAAYGAMKIFNATVGEAMKMERSEVTIEALFNDKQASTQYMKMIKDMAIKSPVFDTQEMFDNSKSYVSISKNNDQLREMWKLTELLIASDPAQGVEGAVLAMRELFSGDSQSLVERFELPRQALNDIKKMDLDDQLTAMNELMRGMGYTEDLINKMGDTSLGKVTQVKERIQQLFRDIGTPAVGVVADFMDDILKRFEGPDIQKFANWGAKIMQGIVSGVRNASVGLYDYMSSMINNPEFQKITTINGKVIFILEDLAAKFEAWWSGGGEAKIIEFGSKVAQVLVAALDASGAAASVGAAMGAAVWQGILNGVKSSAASSPIGSVLSPLLSGVNASLKFINDPFGVVSKSTKNFENKHGKKDKGHYHGIDSVPRDGYQATLHKGERVMTRQENNEFKQNGGFGGGAIAINISGVTITNGMDINAFATQLANEIERKVSVGV